MKIGLIGTALSLLCSGIAQACEIDDYDQVAPAALIGELSAGDYSFIHASDAEFLQNDNQKAARIWNYIHNNGSEHLAIRWPRAGIVTGNRRPLPIGKTYCHKYTTFSLSESPDEKAVIIYGYSEEQKPAPVYVIENPLSFKENFETTIESAYVDLSTGEVVDYKVVFSAELVKGRIINSINVEPENLNLYLGNPIVQKENFKLVATSSEMAGAKVKVIYPHSLHKASADIDLRNWAKEISEYNDNIDEKLELIHKSDPKTAEILAHKLFIDKNDLAIVYSGDVEGVDFGVAASQMAVPINALIFDHHGSLISSIPLSAHTPNDPGAFNKDIPWEWLKGK